MKLRLTIKNKLLIFILSASIIIFSIIISYILYNFNKRTFEDAQKIAKSFAYKTALDIQKKIDHDIVISKVLAYSNSNYFNENTESAFNSSNKLLERIANENPQFVSTWTNWELKELQKDYDKEFGHKRFIHYRNPQGELISVEEEFDIETESKGGYYKIKHNPILTIVNPYKDTYRNSTDTILMTSICQPFFNGDKFAGLNGVDISLDYYNKLISKLKIFKTGYAFLLSNNSRYISHPEDTLVGNYFKNINPYEDSIYHITENVKQGNEITFMAEHTDSGQKLYVIHIPVQIGNTNMPWSLGMLVPMNDILKESDTILINSLIVALIGIILLFFTILFISRSIGKSINIGVKYTEEISKGNLNTDFNFMNNDEIGDLTNHIKLMASKLKEIVEKIKLISEKLKSNGSNLMINSREMITNVSIERARADDVSNVVEEMQTNIKDNAINSATAEEITDSIAKQVIKNTQESAEAIHIMNQVAEKIQIIDEISSKTDMLAINAAIEAARAGEHGKGFSVVSSEIRKLAEQSQHAAKEITELANTSVIAVKKSGNNMELLVPEIEKTVSIVKEIYAGAKIQSTTIDGLDEITVTLNQIADENTTNSESINNQSNTLLKMAGELNELIKYFKI